MKKNFSRFLALLLVVCTVAAAFAACGSTEPVATETEAPTEPVHVDYAAMAKLDMAAATQKYEVTWGERSHIDGDTSHFNVPTDFDASGLVKVRYLAVNTPETTGQIQEWGKAASRFTKEKLSTAVSIILESDGENWGFDGNGRYLCWVWYKPAEGAEYRNLNIELLQNGLGRGSSSSEGRYGSIAVAAIAQATTEKLHVFSGEQDPEFPYAEATPVTLRELRTNITAYVGQRVSIEGVITCNSNWQAYIESYDNETKMNYGIQIFYGYNAQLHSVLYPGNKVRVVGVVGEHYGTYQIMDLKYNAMRPQDPANTSVIKETDAKYNEIVVNIHPEITAADFVGEKTVTVNEEEKTFKFAELGVSTSVSLKNLKVNGVYTTDSTNPNSDGAMTLTCSVDGITISIRTAVLKDADGNTITQDLYEGKMIDIKGIIEHYEGSYQIKVLSSADISVH